jgi:tetratricopeptide (TPR) repeat protein
MRNLCRDKEDYEKYFRVCYLYSELLVRNMNMEDAVRDVSGNIELAGSVESEYGLVKGYLLLSIINFRLNMYEKAADYSCRAYSELADISPRPLVIRVVRNMIMCYESAGRKNDAYRTSCLYEKILKEYNMRNRGRDTLSVSYCYQVYADYFLSTGNITEAGKYLDSLRLYFGRRGYRKYPVGYYSLMTEYDIALGDYKGAMDIYRKMLPVIRNSPKNRLRYLRYEAEIRARLNDYDGAARTYFKLFRMRDSANMVAVVNCVRRIRERYGLDEKKLEIRKMNNARIMRVLFLLIAAFIFIFVFYSILRNMNRFVKSKDAEIKHYSEKAQRINRNKEKLLVRISKALEEPVEQIFKCAFSVANFHSGRLVEKYDDSLRINYLTSLLSDYMNDVLLLSRLQCGKNVYNASYVDIAEITARAVSEANLIRGNAYSVSFQNDCPGFVSYMDGDAFFEMMCRILIYMPGEWKGRSCSLDKYKISVMQISGLPYDSLRDTAGLTIAVGDIPNITENAAGARAFVSEEINKQLVSFFGGSYIVRKERDGKRSVIIFIPQNSRI